MRPTSFPRVASIALALFMASGCVGELTPTPGVDPGPGGGPDAGVDNSAAAKAYFETNVQPLLAIARPKGACTVCHEGANPADGPDFLGATPAANYDLLSVNSRLVAASPATSIFVTRGDHTGDSFCGGVGLPYAGCLQDEVTIISEWINMENGN